MLPNHGPQLLVAETLESKMANTGVCVLLYCLQDVANRNTLCIQMVSPQLPFCPTGDPAVQHSQQLAP